MPKRFNHVRLSTQIYINTTGIVSDIFLRTPTTVLLWSFQNKLLFIPTTSCTLRRKYTCLTREIIEAFIVRLVESCFVHQSRSTTHVMSYYRHCVGHLILLCTSPVTTKLPSILVSQNSLIVGVR